MTKIAIIGSSGLFPGSSTAKKFWENLMSEKDLTDLANVEDFGSDPDIYFHPEKGKVDGCYSMRGGYIRNFEFDPSGYKLSADFLEKQDKLYQWSIHVANDALKDSGYINDTARLKKCGLILGNLSFPTGSTHKLLSSMYTKPTESALQDLLKEPKFKIRSHNGPHPENEVLEYTPSQMVIEALGLGANHYALDAACATSLYAIKLGCDELVTGKADMMLAGAVCASDQMYIHMGFSIFHAYAGVDQKFVPLDKNSGGLVSSEGAGMVVLKRLEDAERDGDQILAVIGNIGLSNDGRGKFLLSPNPKGQRLAFERAYDIEGLSPENTSFLECHATGTPLGDVTEMNSISDFFEGYKTKPLLGSVKSNMGHLLTAAGMPGLLKVMLAMQKNTIPPNINLEDPVVAENGWIDKNQMVLEPTEWNDKEKQAGINSFGFGGTNAHMVIQNHIKRQLNFNVSKKVPLTSMAIVGMEAHFGDCTNLDDFYQTIYQGRQHFKDLPIERWSGFDGDKELLKTYGFKNGKAPKGAYIEDFEIDLLRYKIQPNETETLEPQQALILKVADHAILDAGLEDGQNVAVLIAMEPELANHRSIARWDVMWQLENALKENNIVLNEVQKKALMKQSMNSIYPMGETNVPSQHTSYVGNIMACRIASLWDFSGPAFTVSCGDNSVFKALEIAQNMLSQNEVDAVVVGGVEFSGGVESVLLRNEKDPVNQNEKPSLNLNKNDEGWLIGEGAGAIVLKKKSNAKKDRVYATIDNIAHSAAIGKSDYIELTATGIEAQDQIEHQYLSKLKPKTQIALGSIKTNIGHTFAASGIASVIKTALCVHHKFIPGIPNWEAPKDIALFDDGRLYFPQKSRPWILQNGKKSRQAIVRGFGNSQIQLTERNHSSTENKSFMQNNVPHIFPLKGHSAQELEHQLSALEIALDTEIAIKETAATFYVNFKQKSGSLAIVIVASDRKSAQSEIRFIRKALPGALQNNKPLKTPKGSYFTPNPLGEKGNVAFVYPGSSTAYTGLGNDIFQLFPELYEHFRKMKLNLDEFICSDYLYPKQISVADVPPNIYEDAISMMSVGVFYSTCFTHILQSIFKLNPDIALGYSMGECSSMWYALEVWGPEGVKEFQHSPIFQNRFAGELELLAEHWKISSEEAKAKWISLVLIASKEEVLPIIDKTDDVYLTFINTDREVVISGDREKCLAISKSLKCHTIEIPFQNVIHHDFCKAERKGLLKMHDFPIQKNLETTFISSISKKQIPLESKTISINSTEVCCHSVDFPATIQTAQSLGANIFIEIGANATCTGWIKEILKDEQHLAVSINQKGKSDSQCLVEVIAQLLSHGIDLDISSMYITQKDDKQKRHFFKKIIPGGKRIYDTLLNEENRKLFADRKYATSTVAKNKDLVLEHSNHSVKQKSISNMESNIIIPQDKSNSVHNETQTGIENQIAENGLRLQNFGSGEQFEGKEIVFSQQDLETFATGKISDVFGPEYAIIDTYSRRVMLPMYPYLLVSRVTALRGKRGNYKPSFMQTEYDIPYNAWYTTDRQIPTAVSVESGQCDLLLISYLGIDFENKGDLVYRLLDCTLTFVDDLPFEGQTLRYDISINSFVRNAENLLFFFSYRCYVQDRLVLKMDGGCAGFFNDEQLEEGKGVVYSDSEIEIRKTAPKKHFAPLLHTAKTAFSKDDLMHLINGDIEKCFGDESYFANGRNPSLCLPPEKILMLDRITSVDMKGGAYGLGYIVAEKDLHPDDWYFPCHFRDDEVLAGSLQAEGGGNLLRFFMLMLGLQRLTKDARYQPIYDLSQKVRCRKQVTPQKDTKLVYKLEIKEIGLIPNPYIIGDLEIISDGIITVHFENLGLQLREKSNPKYLEEKPGVKIAPRSKGALLNEKDLTTFALDDLSKCFGPNFAVYDGGKVSRQPNTDLQLISRVVKVDGAFQDFSKPSTIYAEYDVPENAWYYENNAAMTMPYSILMEIALQPCGLLGAYLGSTLLFDNKSLFIRNLDGDGELFDLPNGTDFRGKTIENKTVLVSSVALGGTVLQNYTFELSIEGHVFYKGNSSFGFFSQDALASQVGLDNKAEVGPWYEAEGLTSKDYMQIKLDSLYGKMKLYKAPEGKPHYRLAEDQLDMLHTLRIAKEGGQYGKGYVHATKFVKKYDWYFTCHFYQDPVMPGSLGLESILQAMQVYALQQDLGKDFNSPKFVQLANHKTVWKYRGQILLPVKEMHLEVHIKSVEQRGDVLAVIADAYLWNEKMRIYHVTDLALGIEES